MAKESMPDSVSHPLKLAPLEDLAAQFSLDAIYLFGSRAKEVAAFVRGKRPLVPGHPSDVDVGVMPTAGHYLTVHDKVHLAIALEDLWDVGRVDLVLLPEANPFLAVDIVAGERMYARDAYAMDEYELYVLRRAGDLAPFERERRRHVLWEKHA
jgi:predicted nucleotidyltransferase